MDPGSKPLILTRARARVYNCRMFRETAARSLVKALSYRLSGSLTTVAIVAAVTGRFQLALGVGGLDLLAKLVVYYLHERAWNHLRFGRHLVEPAVIWLTGLSGAGKSTIADAVHAAIVARGLRCERLDGDTIRDLFPSTGFTKADRDAHIKRVGYLASKLEAHDVFVVASFISPYAEARGFVRSLCKRFVEVHVSTPLAVCQERDPKGLYAKARRGEIKGLTGLDDPYEKPESPELALDTARASVDECVARVLASIGV